MTIRTSVLATLLFLAFGEGVVTKPVAAVLLLDSDFDLPEGFHIYRYYDHRDFDTAYSIAFDRQARLYVGDGENILRVSDTDGDVVADSTETIAKGLGERGPQGLLFLDDKIFANGAGTNWILEDLDANGIPQSRRKIGGPVKTGGDHEAHGFVRGQDGYVYWMAGNESGYTPEGHITEKNSPIRNPVESTVFRIGPDGERWEALSTGSRNPFDIAINYLGEIMTVDSDHEGQIGLPYYRPVRFTNFVAGGRLGWSSWDGKTLPSYEIDNLPGLHIVGRGSPTGVVFYEHNQFPQRYRDALLMGDYMNKRGINLEYAKTGQIQAFFLERNGATWKVRQENFVKPRAESGMGPKFAVIDMAVAPDGSLLLTTRSDGVLRIYYDAESQGPRPVNAVPGVVENLSATEEILTFPQAGEAWAQPRLETLAKQVDLQSLALDTNRTSREQLRAIRLLSPTFKDLSGEFLSDLCSDGDPEVRAQAIWLVGLRAKPEEIGLAQKLLADSDALVQRRAAEALARFDAKDLFQELLPLLSKKDRWVRYAAMHALSHRNPKVWAKVVFLEANHRAKLAGLVALSWTQEFEKPNRVTLYLLNDTMRGLWEESRSLLAAGPIVSATPLVELLRVTEIWREKLEKETLDRVASKLTSVLSHPSLDVLRESSRLAGRLKLPAAVPTLVERLPNLPDPVLQIHILDQLAAIDDGWTALSEEAVTNWLDASDEGWHGDLRSKGSSYPGWWERIVTTYVDKHTESVLKGLSKYNLTGPFGEAALKKSAAVGAPKGVDLDSLWEQRKTRIENRRRNLLAEEGRSQRSNEKVREFVLSSAVEGGMPQLGEDSFNYLCMTCHAKGSAGSRRGPNLDTVRSATPEFLIDSILHPNLKVAEEFRSRHVTLTNGDIVTGTLLEEKSGTITLAGEGEPIKIGRSDIERITVTDTSAMPENLLNALTWNEIRDLWAFLRENTK